MSTSKFIFISSAVIIFSHFIANTSAHATDLLTKDNQGVLCEPGQLAGTRFVSPDNMYALIVTETNVPARLVRRGTDFAKMALDANYPSDSDLPNSTKKLKAVRKLKNEIISEIQGLQALRSQGIGAPIKGYRFFTTNASTANIGFKAVDIGGVKRKLFTVDGDQTKTVGIECIETEKKPQTANNDDKPSFARGFRLRKNLNELAIVTGSRTDQSDADLLTERQAAELATLSFTRDYENKTKSLGAEAVLGYRVQNWTPFIGFKAHNQDGQDDDIEYITSGLQYDRLFKTGNAGWFVQSKGQAYGVFDREHDAESIKFRISAEPGGNITDGLPIGGQGFLFGGNLAFLPSVNLFSEGVLMMDQGTNTEFTRLNDYWGLGGEANIKLSVPYVPIANSALLSLGCRYFRIVSDDDKLVRNFHVSLDWTPKDTPYFGVALSYDKGDDAETLQEQDIFKISFGARY